MGEFGELDLKGEGDALSMDTRVVSFILSELLSGLIRFLLGVLVICFIERVSVSIIAFDDSRGY